MSLQERGAYITLLSVCWLEGSLPNDTAHLAKLCGAPIQVFRRIWPALDRCFRINGDGQLIHPRLDKERAKQDGYRRRQSDKGKAGADKRWHRHSTGIDGVRSPAITGDSSPICNLQSATPVVLPTGELTPARPSRGLGSGVMAGALPRDHLRHAWCGRVCVPDFLHGQFMQQLGMTSDAIKAFYEQTLSAMVGPIGDDPVTFWKKRVAAAWPSNAGEAKLTTALKKASDW